MNKKQNIDTYTWIIREERKKKRRKHKKNTKEYSVLYQKQNEKEKRHINTAKDIYTRRFTRSIENDHEERLLKKNYIKHETKKTHKKIVGKRKQEKPS